jgi:hypothetical protein
MPSASEFRAELERVFRQAEERGLPYVDVKSADLHRRLGGYPGSRHQMPTCCNVMWSYREPTDEVISQPPSGKGASLKIRYKLPRRAVQSKASATEEEPEALAMDTSISLERDLEKNLLLNLEQLEPGLRLYADKGVSGQQFDTGEVGRLDILAVDENDGLVVIELKAGTADDTVCGQILRYLGWVSKNLAGGRETRGLIVANDFSRSVSYAAEAMPNVSLKRYEILFQFTDV